MQRGQGHAGRPQRDARPRTRAARTPPTQFDEFMAQARRLLPGATRGRRRAGRLAGPPAAAGRADDALAVAAAARGAGRADGQALGRRRPGRGDGPARRQPAGAAPRPGPGAAASGCAGEQPLGYGDAARRAGGARPTSTTSSDQLGQDYPGATLDDVDVEAVERQLGRRRRRRPARRCASWSASCERQGYLHPRRRRARADPEGACAGSAQTALRRVFAAAATPAGRGDHDDRDAGPAGEPPALTRPWEFGDEQPLDVVAHGRQRARAAAGLPHGAAVRLDGRGLRGGRDRAADLAPRSRCASTCRTRWCCEGRWGPMKQTALALTHLVATRFPQDALQIIGFTGYARRLLAGASWPRSSRTGCRAPTCSTR